MLKGFRTNKTELIFVKYFCRLLISVNSFYAMFIFISRSCFLSRATYLLTIVSVWLIA